MGRVKKMFMKEQEMVFEMELGYEQWLSANVTELTEDELSLMERDSCKSLAVENQMIAHYSANCPDYQSYLGA